MFRHEKLQTSRPLPWSTRFVLKVGLLVVLAANLLNAQVDFERVSARNLRSDGVSIRSGYLDSEFVPTSYRAFAADLLWIDTLIRDGEFKRAGQPSLPNLIEAGRAISNMDPLFRAPYEWIPAGYLSRRPDVSETELIEISDYLSKGIETFRNDWELPYRAALNFIGYSNPQDGSRRIRELRKALELLKIAEARPNADDIIPRLKSAFRQRMDMIRSEQELDDHDVAAILEASGEKGLVLLSEEQIRKALHSFDPTIQKLAYVDSLGVVLQLE